MEKRNYHDEANTDTSTNTETAEITEKITKVKEYNFGILTKNETKREVSGSFQFVETNTTSFTGNSIQSSQQEYYQGNENISSESTSVSGGIITLSYRIKNLSEIAVKVSRLILTVSNREADGTIKPILSLDPTEKYGAVAVGPNSETNRLTLDGDLNLQTTRKLLLNPSGLITEVGIFEMTRTNNEGNDILDYTIISTSIVERTTMITIDKSDGSIPERYSIRTSFRRDSSGQQEGISIWEAMDILKNDPDIDFEYETILYDVIDPETNSVIGQSKHLSSINGKASVNPEQGFWAICSSSSSMKDPLIDFEDIVLKRGNYTSLVYYEGF